MVHSHESLVMVDVDGSMLVPMANVYGTATRLTEGMEVGYAQPLESIKSELKDHHTAWFVPSDYGQYCQTQCKR